MTIHSPLSFPFARNFQCGGECSPQISATTTATMVKQSMQTPVGVFSPTSIKFTWPYQHSLGLHTIPPFEISTKSPRDGKFHPTSQPPPQIAWSNQATKYRRIRPL